MITSQTSLRTQILVLCGFSTVLTAGGAAVSMTWAAEQSSNHAGSGAVLHWLLTSSVVTASILGLGLMMLAVNRIVSSLIALREGMSRVITGELERRPAPPPVASDLGHLQETFDQMVTRLREAREENQNVQQALQARKRTVDRLLDFSQTIQGAGKAEQVYPPFAISCSQSFRWRAWRFSATT